MNFQIPRYPDVYNLPKHTFSSIASLQGPSEYLQIMSDVFLAMEQEKLFLVDLNLTLLQLITYWKYLSTVPLVGSLLELMFDRGDFIK